MNLNEFKNLVDLFFDQVKKQNPNTVFLEWLNTVNRKKFTWSETIENINKLSINLKKYVNEGDRCLLISENRPEWLMADIAIMSVKGITVPAYTTYTAEDYKFLIEDCEPSVLIISNNSIHKKLEKIIKDKNFIKKIITFDSIVGANYQDRYLDFSQIIKTKYSEVNNISVDIKRTTPACIIYTSGTGGNPKGVILTHGGILSNCEGAVDLIEPLLTKKVRR